MNLEQVEQIHRSAQAQLGLIGGALAASQFMGVDPVSGAGVQGWARLVSAQIVELRELSVHLAVSAYQLGRVFQTGSSWGEPAGGAISARQMGAELVRSVEAIAALPQSHSDLGADVRSLLTRNEEQATGLSLESLAEAIGKLSVHDMPDAPVRVDSFDWPRPSPQVPGQVAALLTNAVKNKPSPQVHVTGLADKAVLGGGRDVGMYAASFDPSVLLWARGTSATPCAFCAMLAANLFRKPNQYSRQWVVEHTDARTLPGAFDDVLTYIRSAHPNCKCYPIFRHVGGEEDLPERNVFYRQMWHEVTDGIQGTDAVSASRAMRRAYRRWITTHKERNAGVINTNDTNVYTS